MLLAIAMPIARLVEPVMTTTVVSALFETSAWMIASLSALTSMFPCALTVELRTRAVVSAGFALPNALAISGSPRIVSSRLNRMFCEFQPIELKASVTPAPSPALWIEFSAVASICDRFSAWTTTSPAVVITGDSSISASAFERITFVAITKPRASEVPPLLSAVPAGRDAADVGGRADERRQRGA